MQRRISARALQRVGIVLGWNCILCWASVHHMTCSVHTTITVMLKVATTVAHKYFLRSTYIIMISTRASTFFAERTHRNISSFLYFVLLEDAGHSKEIQESKDNVQADKHTKVHNP